ncbi:MAG: 5-formyltetrahydrofolate cyclo-ligase [Pseudomonadota bacterium]|nr:5-formyltetrahydrofolate cyclo-ligase [Pseudomonadota bacterium]
MNESRKNIRTEIIQQRKALSSEEIAEASKLVGAHIVESDFWAYAKHIAFYIAQNGETDPQQLLMLAEQQGKICYLPALAGTEHNELVMVQYSKGDPLPLNRYRIPEPIQDPAKIIAPNELDLVLVPLVAYDIYGTRLGMGLGFYDRSFAFLNTAHRPAKPLLVGLAYRFQQANKLPREDWDVPLDKVATPEMLINTTSTHNE